MKTVSFESPTKGLITYADKKRHFWLFSTLYPLFPLVGFFLHYVTGNEMMLWVPIVMAYVVVPLTDYLLGEDESNPPEEVVPQLEQDGYYNRLLYLTVPLHYVTLFVSVYWIAMQNLSFLSYGLVAIAAGLAAGLAINTAHELGHKADAMGRNMAKFAMGVSGYGHFCLEHVAGHHRFVATPEDSASSKMGESIYRFVLREIPGGFKRGWRIEKARLKRKGLSTWSLHNELLQSYAITVLVQGAILLMVGWYLLPFLLIHNIVAWLQLSSANYIEHYGLLRAKTDAGGYERCQPHHSWNSNHVFSNLLLYHLERHSDHHAYPTRHYQSLRHFEDLPQLPNGYAGAFLLAYMPPLWYKVIDPILLQLPHIQGDLNKVNMLEGKEDKIRKRYADLIKS